MQECVGLFYMSKKVEKRPKLLGMYLAMAVAYKSRSISGRKMTARTGLFQAAS